jgi:O-antigen ligase
LEQEEFLQSPDTPSYRSKFVWYLWLFLLAVIPVTSFPPLARAFGGIVLVSPLAMVPMGLIIVAGLIPNLARGHRLPSLSRPIMFFIFLAVLSAAVAFLLPILPYKGQSIIERETRAGFTLLIGLGFYLTAATLPRTEGQIMTSLRAIYLGLVVLAVWSAVQAWIVIAWHGDIPDGINRIHRWLVLRDLFPDRVTGLAYEPSWLGDQIAIIYLPLLLASVFTGVSAVIRFGRWISVELLLIGCAMTILVLSKSRISLLSVGVLLACLILGSGYSTIRSWLARRNVFHRTDSHWRDLFPSLLSIMALLLFIIALAVSLLWGLTRLDPRMGNLFGVTGRINELNYYYPRDLLYALANRLTLAERFVYWTTAFRTFSAYPLLGVGPGNAGFMFEKFLPVFGYQLDEIQNVIRYANFGFPNPKSLWLRILAEQGIVGMIVFVLWLIMLGLSARALLKSANRMDRFIGLAGVLCLLSQVFEGFSLDTYALPQLWIMLGLLTSRANKRLLDQSSTDLPVLGAPRSGSGSQQLKVSATDFIPPT